MLSFTTGYLYDTTGNYWASFSVAGSFQVLAGLTLFGASCLQSVKRDIIDQLHTRTRKSLEENNQITCNRSDYEIVDRNEPVLV